MVRRPARAFRALLLAIVGVGVPLRAQRADVGFDETLRRVGAYVESYHARAQSIVALETVVVQNVTRDLGSDGFARRYVYNLRVEWTPNDSGTLDASLSRELLTVNGKVPKPDDEPHCTAPKPITPEPLAMFLPERQAEFIFHRPEPTELDGRTALRFNYRIRRPEKDSYSWDRDCVNMEFPSRLRGSVWVDASGGEVLRIDEGANGPVEMERPPEQVRRGARETLRFERWTETIRYRPVAFTDPDETLLLPARIESLAMAGAGGTRRVQTYSNYRRFVTEGRIVE
jgi:hypothetical protein